LLAVIPKSTITCFTSRCAFPIRPIAPNETPVLDEIDDLFAAKDKNVEIVVKGKSLKLSTPKGRKLKARLVEAKQC
jgi:hypothetical protein